MFFPCCECSFPCSECSFLCVQPSTQNQFLPAGTLPRWLLPNLLQLSLLTLNTQLSGFPNFFFFFFSSANPMTSSISQHLHKSYQIFSNNHHRHNHHRSTNFNMSTSKKPVPHATLRSSEIHANPDNTPGPVSAPVILTPEVWSAVLERLNALEELARAPTHRKLSKTHVRILPADIFSRFASSGW